MLNCIDMDGQNAGYCLPLIKAVVDATSIPVIASSGAGNPQHFQDVFEATNCEVG
jgi:glutamine amidotransferase/cyclase